jgi:hypothetical protein
MGKRVAAASDKVGMPGVPLWLEQPTKASAKSAIAKAVGFISPPSGVWSFRRDESEPALQFSKGFELRDSAWNGGPGQ